MDVKTAFLNGNLEEDIYMKQPEGFTTDTEHVCKLHKALYGLKQAPRAWYQRLDQFLTSHLNFIRSTADPSMYIRSTGPTYLAVYVDDILIVSPTEKLMQDVKEQLSAEFPMKDLGEVSYVLGVQLQRTKLGIHMCQQTYIENLLKRYEMQDCHGQKTPMTPPDVQVSDSLDSPLDLAVPYRQAVGSLMYAMVATRPDLAFSVSVVAQYMSSPTVRHWQWVKRIFRYLKLTSSYGLWFPTQSATRSVLKRIL